MTDYTDVVVLCEGKQDEVFLRRFLKSSGINRRRIRVRRCPPGLGSGKQFVQNEYAKEAAEHRRRATFMHNIALIVMHDCDTSTVEECRAVLDPEGRQPGERIALLFPKRSIETWIRFLVDGQAVDESIRYPELQRESECHDVADRLARKQEYVLSAIVPSSLRDACPEIRRIFPTKVCRTV